MLHKKLVNLKFNGPLYRELYGLGSLFLRMLQFDSPYPIYDAEHELTDGKPLDFSLETVGAQMVDTAAGANTSKSTAASTTTSRTGMSRADESKAAHNEVQQRLQRFLLLGKNQRIRPNNQHLHLLINWKKKLKTVKFQNQKLWWNRMKISNTKMS